MSDNREDCPMCHGRGTRTGQKITTQHRESGETLTVVAPNKRMCEWCGGSGEYNDFKGTAD